MGAHHRPTIRAVVGDWVRDAACRDAPIEWFFSGEEADERRALALCRRCPVQSVCDVFAQRHHELHGLWGGMPERERRTALRARDSSVA